MRGYSIMALTLLAAYEEYLPYMTDAEILDILEYGVAPPPWIVRRWENQKRRASCTAEGELNAALKRQK